MPLALTAGPPAPLPLLREDLELAPGPADAAGRPTWLLHDPLSNRYIRLPWLHLLMLERWALGSPAAIAAALGRETASPVAPEDVEAFARWLAEAELTAASGEETARRMIDARRRKRRNPLVWLVESYLFIRIPLAWPDAFITRSWPWVSPLWSAGFRSVTVLAALAGLVMILPQWQGFFSSFSWLFTPVGAALATVTILVSKFCHEMAHAYTLKRHGCRVGAMGVALLVLWPVFFTEANDAWRLKDRRARLDIAAAGMMAEFALSAWALFLWPLLPDGPLRSLVFLLATTTWVLTLIVNTNPLMRFDGYFLLADGLDEPNLQGRAFARARWWLRETLFGFREPPPEQAPRRPRFLVVFGLAVWVYRFFLFLGIALLVYHIFFKLLGIVLMLIEIGHFILRPVVHELAQWWRRRDRVRLNRATLRTLGLALIGIGLLVWPFSTAVEAPAVLRGRAQGVIFAPEAGQVARLGVAAGDWVAAGQTLLELSSPLLEEERRLAALEVVEAEAALSAALVSTGAGVPIPQLVEQLATAIAARDRLEARAARLILAAPFAGRLVEIDPALRPGAWVGGTDPLMVLVDPAAAVEAWLPEEEAGRLDGTSGRFIPDAIERPALEVTVSRRAPAPADRLEATELASLHGGPVPVHPPDDSGRLVPEGSWYRLDLTAAGAPPVGQVVPGVVQLPGTPESLAGRVLRHVQAVLVRESGF